MKNLFQTWGKWIRRGFKTMLVMTILAIIVMTGLLSYVIWLGPPSLVTDQNTIYYGRDGNIIGEDQGETDRYWVGIDEIPEVMTEATIAIEDHRFYDHFGFDVKRIASAIITDLKAMKKVEGASTITQQYARNLYLSHEKSWKRKFHEALYAVRLEVFYTKEEILQGYLNTIYYGHGAYGIEAASRHYFDKSVEDITLEEAAMLAGIPKGPTYYSPLVDLDKAHDRQAQVLAQMNTHGYIDEDAEVAAAQKTLNFNETKEEVKADVAPYFQDTVIQEAQGILKLNREEIEAGGYHIYTTLDEEHQQRLEENVAEHIADDSEIEAGGMVMDKSGAVTALIGGRDYEKSQYNRALQNNRSVGSTIKPFLYYAALQHGYSPVTELVSEPTTFEQKDGEAYHPSNYNGYYAKKPITMAQALALSDNIYAVKTNMDIGPDELVDTLHTFGVEGDLPAVPSLALGTAGISLYDMMTGYTRLLNGSGDVTGHTITKITDRLGHVLYEYSPDIEEKNEIDPDRAFMVTHMMTGMFDTNLNGYMNVTGSSIANQLTHLYGGKSGTTETDSWMIGFSPDYTAGIWTGYDKNRELKTPVDEVFAKNVWANLMEDIHEDQALTTFSPSDGVEGVYIDPESGLLASPQCPKQRLIYMREEDVPKKTCDDHEGSDDQEIEDNLKKDPWFKEVVDWFF
ncbi:transglycosylase domain-containing protein [Thalassobacillus sp. CUG 92003]|uniref:transglycosylase domain-containing protein n=1 Tax=Thalassobacillus sp. CUG 92003 TaxID=2736641 RepID=UPI0015E6DA6C|nr:PBP1A family penicillin-binding protein [Thalassobacillus sp. CUG 92003]